MEGKIQFEIGTEVWLTVGGEPDEGGGIFAAKVKAINGNKMDLEMIDPVQSDLEQVNQYVKDAKVVVSGSTVQNVSDGNEAPMRVVAALRDPSFPDAGYTDMVDLKNLNDAELAYNLRLKFNKDISYCYCGNTCVAINIFYMGKKPRSDDWEDQPHVNGDKTQPIFDVFAPENQKKYMKAKVGDNAPHVYAIAEAAYQGLFHGNIQEGPKPQAMIITGESGAGKTYITGKVLQYLDSVNSENGGEKPAEGCKTLTQKIMATMPIMDAFGNACMPRNNDSSRFGKLYKIYYDLKTELVKGAQVTPYLLEKSRVNTQASWERGFHLFYRMLAGSDAAMKEKYKLLAGPGEYGCLNRFLKFGIKPGPNDLALEHEGEICMFEICDKSKYSSSDPKEFTASKVTEAGKDSDDVKEWKEFMEAMDTYFPDEAIKEQIFSIVSAVLLLSNLKFEDNNRGQSEVGPQETLEQIADLLKVNLTALIQALTRNKLEIMGKIKFSSVAAIKASQFCEAFASALYNDLFVQIVREFSEQLMQGASEKDRYLGVLDIFGFEFIEPKDLVKSTNGRAPFKLTTDINGFNQFNINLCNEKLQSHFVGCVFDAELNTFKLEGVPITEDDFNFERNDATVDLLMNGAKDSVLNILDKETLIRFTENNPDRIVRGKFKKDEDFRKKCDSAFAQFPKIYHKTSHSDRNRPPKNYDYESFGIHHYAATVTYNLKDWWESNGAELPKMVHEVMDSSEWKNSDKNMLKTFLEERGENASGKPTVGGQFRAQLKELVAGLDNCFCQFVRCIKPNKMKWSRATAEGGPENAWQSALVLNQLRYTGMLDTLIIRKGGYPARPHHKEFWKQFYVLYPKILADAVGDSDRAGALVKCIQTDGIDGHPANEFGDKNLFQGKTRTLMKDDTYRYLEAAALEKKKVSVLEIQTMIRGATKAAASTFKEWRAVGYVALSEARKLVARALLFKAEDCEALESDRAEFSEYLKSAEEFIRAEREERAQMRTEEDYTQEWMMATAAARFASDKKDSFDDAKGAYDMFKSMYSAWSTEHETTSLTELLNAVFTDEPIDAGANLEEPGGSKAKFVMATGRKESQPNRKRVVWNLKKKQTF